MRQFFNQTNLFTLKFAIELFLNIFLKYHLNRLYNDKNRTFLQWSGDTSYRSLLQGRLIVLRLACWKDSSLNLNSIEDPLKSIRNLSSCIAFRVLGSLLKHATSKSHKTIKYIILSKKKLFNFF